MKRLIAFLLVLALTPICALAESDYVTLPELRAQAPERWTQTYETKWRTVEIDAPILLPDIDTVPIVQVARDMSQLPLTAEESGWDNAEKDERGLLLDNNGRKVPRSVDGKRINSDAEQKGDWYGDFAPENTYVPMSDIPYGEICDMLRKELVRFGYEADSFAVERPFRIWSQHWYYYGYKKDALPGHIMLEAPQVIHGLPILTHIWDVVRSHNGETGATYRNDEYWEQFGLSAGYDAYDAALSHLFIRAATPTDVLAEDVPLCPLDTVKTAIEGEIEAGHIRKLFEVKLGYVVYNEPGVYRAKQDEPIPYEALRYYLKPVWQVNCLYVDSATGQLRELPGDIYDERNSLDYRQLLVDAQTGALMTESQAQDRCEYKGFIAWEDVK